MRTPDVIMRGKDNGEGMVVRYKTGKGTDVFGLAMPNKYGGTNWDLGPTWCYLISGRENTLIDTGRFGNLEVFQTLLNSTGRKVTDIDRVIPTHSHEDHDGNLAEILVSARAELWAHAIYRQMISYHPKISDGATHPELPGSCRLCVMSEKFSSDCLSYHRKRSLLGIDRILEEEQALPDGELDFIFTPGHTPDSVCILLEGEVLFTGDTLLPDITPHPSLASNFQVNRRILPEEYNTGNTVYGLMVYIKSLNKITRLSSQPIEATFPAHRLFYNGQFNLIHSSSDRAGEIIRFHIDRCRDILHIMGGEPIGVKDIVRRYFAQELLAGSGDALARKEIMAHLEVMEECGDICWANENRDMAQGTGSNNYLDFIGTYLYQT